AHTACVNPMYTDNGKVRSYLLHILVKPALLHADAILRAYSLSARADGTRRARSARLVAPSGPALLRPGRRRLPLPRARHARLRAEPQASARQHLPHAGAELLGPEPRPGRDRGGRRRHRAARGRHRLAGPDPPTRALR